MSSVRIYKKLNRVTRTFYFQSGDEQTFRYDAGISQKDEGLLYQVKSGTESPAARDTKINPKKKADSLVVEVEEVADINPSAVEYSTVDDVTEIVVFADVIRDDTLRGVNTQYETPVHVSTPETVDLSNSIEFSINTYSEVVL